MYKLFVAQRYLRRNWLNAVGIAAVALGVLVLICVLSVMKGFDEEFRSRLHATLSDLIVESWNDDSFSGYQELMAKIEKMPHVVACAPRYDGLALVTTEHGAPHKLRRYAEFQGIDLPLEVKATDFAAYWRAWRGRSAREHLADLLDSDKSVLSSVPRETIMELASKLRAEDFDLLDEHDRRELRLWAEKEHVDLRALFSASAAAMPEWGKVEDPSRESPAFAGSELLVLGQSQEGKPVSLGLGSRLVVITAKDTFERNLRRAVITGEYRSGLYDYDLRSISLPLQDVQKYLGAPGTVTSINVRLDSFNNAPQVRATLLGILTPDELEVGVAVVRDVAGKDDPDVRKLEAKIAELRQELPTWFATSDLRAVSRTVDCELDLYTKVGAVAKSLKESGGNAAALEKIAGFKKLAYDREHGGIGWTKFRISTWEDKRRTFLRAVWLERRMMGFILFFVILIAGFLILSILHTTVLSKTRDIGILKSIGGSVGGIMSIFLLNGLLMGVIGSAIGAAGGLLITCNINRIQAAIEKIVGFSLFPQNIYYLDRIPVDAHPTLSVVVISVTAILMSLLASAYPAWKASRMDAVEALRYE